MHLVCLALAFSPPILPVTVAPRCAAPRAGLLDNIVVGLSDGVSGAFGGKAMGKVMGYSKDDRIARASHILLSFDAYPEGSSPDSKAMANGLKAKIEGGDFTFEFAAEKFSACQSAERGGDLGEFKRGAMVPAFDEAVFKVVEDEPLGTILGPVKTQFGHHLIKVVQRGEP